MYNRQLQTKQARRVMDVREGEYLIPSQISSEQYARVSEEPTDFLTNSAQAVVEPPATIVKQDHEFWSEALAQMLDTKKQSHFCIHSKKLCML